MINLLNNVDNFHYLILVDSDDIFELFDLLFELITFQQFVFLFVQDEYLYIVIVNILLTDGGILH